MANHTGAKGKISFDVAISDVEIKKAPPRDTYFLGWLEVVVNRALRIRSVLVYGLGKDLEVGYHPDFHLFSGTEEKTLKRAILKALDAQSIPCPRAAAGAQALAAA